jgi:hypothetical protein
MFDSTTFRKATGVDLNADEATLVKAADTAVRKGIAADIATALIIRTLVTEHSWKISESAAKVGLSPATASLAGNRGKVIWETGPESVTLVWQTIRTLKSEALAPLATTLQAMTTAQDRTDYVIRLGVASVVSKRLGESGTPDRITAMTDTLVAEGHRTPTAAKGAVAGIAGRLSIPLPVATRPGAASKSAGGTGADVPTFDAAMTAALAAIAQAMEGADEDHPVMLTPEQSRLADEVMGALAALSDIAKVHAIA